MLIDFCKEKNLGVSASMFDRVCGQSGTLHPTLDMNPDSVRVNVQTTALAFSLKVNNFDSVQQWS